MTAQKVTKIEKYQSFRSSGVAQQHQAVTAVGVQRKNSFPMTVFMSDDGIHVSLCHIITQRHSSTKSFNLAVPNVKSNDI